MAEILERPLTVKEAAVRANRHINTIWRWLYSGQLKTLPRSPMDRGYRIAVSDLERATKEKLVQFKGPRRPHLLRKREKDRERWHLKYSGTAKARKYKNDYMKRYSRQPQRIAWRRAYDRKRYAAKKAALNVT